MTLLPDDGGAQHGPVFCRLGPAAGLGQGERVPVELHDRSGEPCYPSPPLRRRYPSPRLLGLSTSWLVERSLLDHHTRAPRPTARYGLRGLLTQFERLVLEGTCSLYSNVASRGCLRCTATPYRVRPWAVRHTPTRAWHMTDETHTRHLAPQCKIHTHATTHHACQ